jgi:hypothetical protein
MRLLIPLILLSVAIPTFADDFCNRPRENFNCTLAGLPWAECEEFQGYCTGPWHWPNVSFSPTTEDDCNEGYCSYATTVNGVDLWGARLNLDFVWDWDMGPCEFHLTILDACGIGCTQLFVYILNWSWDVEGWVQGPLLLESANVNTDAEEILSVALEDYVSVGPIRISVSSCQARLTEFQLVMAPTPVSPSTWSTIKSTY